ncbi:hypothetical protein DEA8626_03470 [Defluviimonas aquaemixtae]|uniref:Uncharacterized protein n=1 Tax=Albidovulum aquaemixtae TaxID=1542388 RepID=A0A2R8BLZ6_9RHOB|nr:hypothetical protein [Defluviimonas aquaemixtae]SPH24418.1 hypothetical protein DEA8626_03470 [Defluviimonas aquaemixtae]
MDSKQLVRTAWDAVMDETKNPLRRFPLVTAHLLMQVLAWMWSAIFSVAIGSYFAFGVTAVGHSLIIAGVIVTIAVFRRAEGASEAG